jgi:LPXTG-motif cell wall-anchored protein
MKKRFLILALVALMSLALVAPAAFAQDDDDDDDNGAVTPAAPLPETGGPALVLPAAGALLIGSGIAGAIVARRNRRDS